MNRLRAGTADGAIRRIEVRIVLEPVLHKPRQPDGFLAVRFDGLQYHHRLHMLSYVPKVPRCMI